MIAVVVVVIGWSRVVVSRVVGPLRRGISLVVVFG
jgi:hypothetical protein